MPHIFTLFETQANKHANNTAIVYGDMRLSYSSLLSDVNDLAKGLVSTGLHSGDVAALFLPNVPEFIVSFYAFTRLGVTVLPINHVLSEQEVQFYLSDAKVNCIITDALRAPMCQKIIDALDVNIRLISIEESSEAQSYREIIQQTSKPDLNELSDESANAVLMYSSGSTGRPKCVPRSYAQLSAETYAMQQTVSITNADSILCIVPMYHTHGLGNCLLAATCSGVKLVILEQTLSEGKPVETPFMFRCPRVFELIEKENVSILPAVPFILKSLASYAKLANTNVKSIRLCFSAGNFLDQSIFDAFLEHLSIPIRQLYGCTEAGALTINNDGPPKETWHSVGKPLRDVTISVVNEAFQVLPTGDIGEIAIKSPGQTMGYANLTKLNDEVFKQGFYLSGDLGYINNEGRLYITGRKKLLIDTGGRKVDPFEVEDAIQTHPSVQETVVVGIKEKNAGEVVKAVIVLEAGEHIEENDIIRHCKNYLTDYKIPKYIEFRKEIPKSPLGKILRKALI